MNDSKGPTMRHLFFEKRAIDRGEVISQRLSDKNGLCEDGGEGRKRL
jgi:hypothetical protein